MPERPDTRVLELILLYIRDRQIRGNHEELQLDEHINEIVSQRIRIFSTFRNATTHQTLIAYSNVDGSERYSF